MNKFLSLLAVLSISGIGNSQIVVPEVQKSFYGVVEATWCGNCGQYGIPITEAVINQAGAKTIAYSLHKSSSSQLYSSTAESIANAIGTSGQPYWTLNGMGLGGYSAAMQTNIINSINATYNATATDVNVGFEWYMENDTIYVETATEFFNSATGDYNVAVYLSEDNIYASQSNYDPGIPSGNIYHDHVLRASLSADAFGVQVASGTISAGSIYSNMYKIAVDPSWDLNQVHLSAMVWKDNGVNNYEFKNANDIGQEIVATGINSRENESFDVEVFPNPVSDNLIVKAINESPESLVRLVDLYGRIFFEKSVKSQGDFSMQINVESLTAGNYILSIFSDQNTVSKRVVVK